MADRYTERFEDGDGLMMDGRTGKRTYPFSDGLSALDSTLHVGLIPPPPSVGLLGELVELLHNLFLVCLEIGPEQKRKRDRVSQMNIENKIRLGRWTAFCSTK